MTLTGDEAAAIGPVPGSTSSDDGTPSHSGHAPRAAASHAPETGRLYSRDWAAFEAWCGAWDQTALPASPETAAAYLALLARRLAPGALARHAAALNHRHRRAGHPAPGDDPGVQAVLQARRAKPAEPSARKEPCRRGAPPSPAQLARMATRCPGDLAGLRDRALLLLAAAGVDREALLSLDRDGVCLTDAGVELTVPGLAGGDAIEGVPTSTVALRRATAALACPVRALEAWLRSAGIRFGPVFCKVDRWGNVEHGRLGAPALRGIWRQRAVPARRGRRRPSAI